jgi:type II secretory pathway component PulC
MSIISDALKKVENSSENRPQLLGSPEPGKKGINRLVVFLLAALTIGIGLFKTLTTRHTPTKQQSSSSSTSLTTSVIPEIQQAALVPAPLEDEKLIQLTGIALMEGKNFAIINGNVFQEGDKVGGAKLVKITKDAVTIDREGRQIQLSLK